MIGRYSNKVVDYLAFVYLRSLSLQKTVEISLAWFEQDIVSKKTLLQLLEKAIDSLPSVGQVTKRLKPIRSGYYAFDGTWFKFFDLSIVLLICFDVKTLDIISYHVAEDENYLAYEELLETIEAENGDILAQAKGFFADGELTFLKHYKARFAHVPLQLCVFHKYSRAGQLMPLKHAKGINQEIKVRVEKVLFATTKAEAIESLKQLRKYASEHQENGKLQKIIGVLKRNFQLLLTHFDNPEMSPYNNVLEGFNHIIKRKLRLTKGFKKELNIHRWLKLMLLDYRFHIIRSSKLPDRNGKSPLQLAEVELPKYHNWIALLRKKSMI